MPLLRVKVSDGNLRKEVEGKLKNPGEILWVSFGLLTRDIFGTSFLLTFKTSAVSIDTAMVLCWPIDKLCVRKLWWRSLLSSRKSSDSSSFWLFKAFQSGQKETFQKVTKGVKFFWRTVTLTFQPVGAGDKFSCNKSPPPLCDIFHHLLPSYITWQYETMRPIKHKILRLLVLVLILQ